MHMGFVRKPGNWWITLERNKEQKPMNLIVTGSHFKIFFNLLKKRFWHKCFPVKFANFLRTPFFIEHYGGCFYIFNMRVLIWSNISLRNREATQFSLFDYSATITNKNFKQYRKFQHAVFEQILQKAVKKYIFQSNSKSEL